MNIADKKNGFNGKQFVIWMAALIVGSLLGLCGVPRLDEFFDFIAKVYTRLFQFIAVPTIALAIMTTLATLGAKRDTGKIFFHTIIYTLLTTFAAAVVGALLYKIIQPGNLPSEMISHSAVPGNIGKLSYYNHILSVVPDNILKPLSSGNVLSILLVASCCGLAIASKRENEHVQVLLKAILGLQEILFVLIKALVWTLPAGIIAFAAQLSSQMSAGVAAGSLGKYIAVVLGGNILQFFVILPLFLLAAKINPLKVFRGMLPAVLMIALASSVKLVMQEGGILDTVMHAVITSLSGKNKFLCIILVYFLILFLQIFIGSSSAKIMLIMPIMLPVCNALGISTTLVTLTYCMADGFTDVIIPTNPVLLIGLSMAKVSYGKWVRFTGLFQLLMFAVTVLILLFATAVGY